MKFFDEDGEATPELTALRAELERISHDCFAKINNLVEVRAVMSYLTAGIDMPGLVRLTAIRHEQV